MSMHVLTSRAFSFPPKTHS